MSTIMSAIMMVATMLAEHDEQKMSVCTCIWAGYVDQGKVPCWSMLSAASAADETCLSMYSTVILTTLALLIVLRHAQTLLTGLWDCARSRLFMSSFRTLSSLT